MAPLAAAMMPAARDISSSFASIPSDMFDEENDTVLAHFYPCTDEFDLVNT